MGLLNSRRTALIAGLVGTALVVGGMALVLNGRAPQHASRALQSPEGLEITKLSLDRHAADGRADVTFDAAWSTNAFPGVYRCTWTARGANGAEVGRISDVIASMSPVASGLKVSIQTSGPVESVDAECDQRLDTGNPYRYAFNDFSLKPTTDRGIPAIDVTYDAEWIGEGHPGPVSCVYAFLDTDGTTIETSQKVMFYAAEGLVSDHIYTVASERFATVTPENVDLQCVPFEGA